MDSSGTMCAARRMKLADFVVPEAILPDLRATTKEGAIREAVDALRAAGCIAQADAAEVVRAVLRREDLGSTGVGDGVAFPEARHPAVGRTLGTIALSRAGIDFDAADGGPVHILFLVISPPDRPADFRARSAELFREAFYVHSLWLGGPMSGPGSSPPVTIRAVLASEWPRVRDIFRDMVTDSPEAFGETLDELRQRPDSEWQAIVAHWAAGTAAVAFLAEDQVGPCGFVRGDSADARTPPGTVLVSNLWTAPRRRGHGVGRALMRAVTQWAEQRRAERIALGVTDANRGVLAFYSALGYRETGRRVPAGLDPNREVMVLVRPMVSS